MRQMVWGAMALGMLACAGIAPARAQAVSDPTVIRNCLCQEQFVLELQDGVSSRRQSLESSQKAQTTLSNQVETRRAQINVYDNAELDAFKQLLLKRDAAIDATAASTQSYDDVANRYNDAVAGYNGSCAGRSYDDTVLRSVRTTLACPRPSNSR